MSNVLKFIIPQSQKERDNAVGHMIIDGALDDLNDRFNGLLGALHDAAEYLEDDVMIDPYLLLDAMTAVYEAHGRDPREYDSVGNLRELCDYLEITEETRDE